MNIWIYSIIQFDIWYICVYMLYYIYIYTYIYIAIYIYIYINIYICIWTLSFFVYCNIVATYRYDGHNGLTFIWSFPAGFTSRYGLHNCEHDPSY